MSNPSRNDVGAYVVHECINCGSPKSEHLFVGTKVQCLFAPGTEYNDLPSIAWLKQAEAGPGGWSHYKAIDPVYVGALPERKERPASTWTPGATMDGEI